MENCHHRVVQVDTGSAKKQQPLAAITSGSTDDLFSVPSAAKKTVAVVPPPPAEADETPGEWIEAFDKARLAHFAIA